MKTLISSHKRILYGIFLSLFWCGAAFAQINVEMVFRSYDIIMPADTVYRVIRYDTCGIRSGNSVGFYNDIEWPPPPPSSFEVRWVTSDAINIPSDSLGDGTYTDIRPLPANIPPYIIDYELMDILVNQNDTFALTWNSLPAEIDSIHIEDISVNGNSTVFGRFFHSYITHQSAFPDSLIWANTPALFLQDMRVRVFYNKSVVNPSGIGREDMSPNNRTLAAFPNPASGYVQFNLPDASISRITLSDALGRNIRSINGMDLRSGLNELSLEELPEGVYMLSAYSKSETYRTQITVMR